MIVSIHQPSYFPWLGLLNKIAKSDVFIILDEVQLMDSGYQHRNIFLTTTGEVKYLTIPVKKKGYMAKKINELLIDNNYNWLRKHRSFLFYNYKNHLHFSEIFSILEQAFFNKSYTFLFDAVFTSMKIVLNMLKINTKIVLQSELDYNRNAKKGLLILELVKAVGGNIYLSGLGAKSYMEDVLNMFKDEKIHVVWNNFRHFHYPQKNSNHFIEGLSSLDFFFNVGIKESRVKFWENVSKEKKEMIN